LGLESLLAALASKNRYEVSEAGLHFMHQDAFA
jgi:hypothetical protein